MFLINRFSNSPDSQNRFPLRLQPETRDNFSTNLTFIGPEEPNWGQANMENFLYLMENFAGILPPSKPVSGQFWYDTTNNNLRQYNGFNWKAVGIFYGAETPLNPFEGDVWFDSSEIKLKIYHNLQWVDSYTQGFEGTIKKITVNNGLTGGEITLEGEIGLEEIINVEGNYYNPQLTIDKFGRITNVIDNYILEDKIINIPMDFSSIKLALEYLNDFEISPNAKVYIDVNGNNTITETININHPQSKNIILRSTPWSNGSFTNVIGITGSYGSYDITLEGNLTGLTIGDFIYIDNVSGDESVKCLIGLWPIIQLDTLNSRFTIRTSLKTTTIPFFINVTGSYKKASNKIFCQNSLIFNIETCLNIENLLFVQNLPSTLLSGNGVIGFDNIGIYGFNSTESKIKTFNFDNLIISNISNGIDVIDNLKGNNLVLSGNDLGINGINSNVNINYVRGSGNSTTFWMKNSQLNLSDYRDTWGQEGIKLTNCLFNSINFYATNMELAGFLRNSNINVTQTFIQNCSQGYRCSNINFISKSLDCNNSDQVMSVKGSHLEIKNVRAIANQNVFSIITSTIVIGGENETLFENNSLCVLCRDNSTTILADGPNINIKNNSVGIICENMSLTKIYSNTIFDNNTNDTLPAIGIQGNRYALIDLFNSGE